MLVETPEKPGFLLLPSFDNAFLGCRFCALVGGLVGGLLWGHVAGRILFDFRNSAGLRFSFTDGSKFGQRERAALMATKSRSWFGSL